jgi:hypothetical protein
VRPAGLPPSIRVAVEETRCTFDGLDVSSAPIGRYPLDGRISLPGTGTRWQTGMELHGTRPPSRSAARRRSRAAAPRPCRPAAPPGSGQAAPQQLTIIEPGQRRVTLRQIISRVDYLSVDGRQLSLTAKVPVGGHRGNAIPRPLGSPPDPELTHAIICFLTNKLS